MDYNALLQFVVDLGYRLAMSGAETFRIEDSINRILSAYGVQSEAFSIPNCLIVSIETPEGKPRTRMRRVGYHGNDLDAVEKYNSLSRRICLERPDPRAAMELLRQTDASVRHYRFPLILFGSFLGAFGFSFMFGASFSDAICSGCCGLLVGLVNRFMDVLKTNQFFRIIAASFIMALPAYGLGALGLLHNTDTAIIGSLMLLVPGLLFVNAMRDIIYGDSNSGINRIMQVLLVAAAICLGTAAAWTVSRSLWGAPVNQNPIQYSLLAECLGCFIGCIGFSFLFNIHGPGGLLCTVGGVITWCAYRISCYLGTGDIMAYFLATLVAAFYSEIMARIRKYPAISYLVVSIFPLIPGAGVYYTMNHAVRGDMESFAQQGIHTIAIAGVMAVGMLLVLTSVHLWTVLRRKHLT